MVEYLHVGGYDEDKIAKIMGIAPKTLRKHYRDQLDVGKARIDALVMEAFITKMLGGEKPDWQKADRDLLKYYTSRRMGWSESHPGEDGSVSQVSLSITMTPQEAGEAYAAMVRGARLAPPRGEMIEGVAVQECTEAAAPEI
jgi:hypothetical protein